MPGGFIPSFRMRPEEIALGTWQYAAQDAAARGEQPIPLSEFGITGQGYDPAAITQRARDAGNYASAQRIRQFQASRPWENAQFPRYPNPIYPGVAPTAAPTTAPTAAPTAAPTVPQITQAQSGLPMVGRLPGPPETHQSQFGQPSPLMQMFNFPTLRKKQASYGGSAAPTGVGQYNENFWNAWRL